MIDSSMRDNKKEYISEILKERFDFQAENEISIYYYVSGIKMTKKHWKNICKEENTNYKFKYIKEWNTYIRNKYKSRNTDQLKEFEKYLSIRERQSVTNINFTSIIIASLTATIFSIALPEIAKLFNSAFSNTVIYDNLLINIILFSLVFFTISILAIICIIFVVKLLTSSFDLYKNQNNRTIFYNDYRKVLTEIINEKSITNQLPTDPQKVKRKKKAKKKR